MDELRGSFFSESNIDKLRAEAEKLKLAEDLFETLYDASEGDCRRAINLLQATASISPDITAEMVKMISSSTKPKDIKVVLDYALAGDFLNARDKLLDLMLKESVAGTDIIKAIQKDTLFLLLLDLLALNLTDFPDDVLNFTGLFVFVV